MPLQPLTAGMTKESWAAREPAVERALIALLFALIVLTFARPFFSGLTWMVYVADDFFYYLKVAQNIAAGHGSTFNGIAKTNGYHPLYELVLVVLSVFTTRGTAILGFVAVLNICAAAVAFFFSRRLFLQAGTTRMLAFALASWTTLYSMRLFSYGMEVTLTIPLALGVLHTLQATNFNRKPTRQAFLLGLLTSAMILSRLDTAILAGLLGLALLVQPAVRRRITRQHVRGLALGLLPAAFYFALNHALFGTWLPISGMAKQLKPNLMPSGKVWHDLYLGIPSFLIVILPIPLGALLLPLVWRKLGPVRASVAAAALAFPFVYYLTIAMRSDWPMWGWYMYALRPAACMGLVMFCVFGPTGRLLRNPAITAFLVLAVFAIAWTSRWRVQELDIQAAAEDIQAFAATHPGVYAMGDRSGRVGYLLSAPMVQTEGLMMDRVFLDKIKAQTPLKQALADYGVTYYIGTGGREPSGCFHAAEPQLAGPASPRMRGDFCGTPQLHVTHLGIENLVYRVDAAR